MLEVRALTVRYGRALAVEDVTFDVPTNAIVAIIGPNGAGKTTLLRAISGLLHASQGTVSFAGRILNGLEPHAIVRAGLVHCPEGRRPFPELAVIENLLLGAPLWPARSEALARLDEIFDLFPRLKERQRQLAGTLSGGEQQMLAFGRALMCRPKLLMLDEPSMGLAPRVVEEVFAAIGKVRAMGITALLVEQNVELALETCEAVAVLDHGRIVFRGESGELMRNTRLKEVYLGLA
jgi:branched-chain amino acid transport system ATP-binding protein